MQEKYIVYITDHGHYMEKSGQSFVECISLDEAIEKCQKIIDRSLDELFISGISEEQLLKQFMLFGEEANTDGFDSGKYIKDRSKKMCS